MATTARLGRAGLGDDPRAVPARSQKFSDSENAGAIPAPAHYPRDAGNRKPKIMTTELAIINHQSALAHLAAVAQQAQERLLKFVKGKWFVGDDEVSAGREFIAHVPQLAQGWVKFSDGKVAEQCVGIVDGFVFATRDDLGATDSSKWEKDAAGAPLDPWTPQFFLQLEDAATGELLAFVTGWQGGPAIYNLANQWMNLGKGLPLVRLAADCYWHKNFGRVEVPEFSVTGWTGASDNFAPRGGGDLDEEIPF
jgi:hypothetical protein